MSKIVIVASGELPVPALSAVAKLLSLSMSDARSRVSEGRPLYEGLLFMNDHEDVALRLKTLVQILQDADNGFRIFELEEDESFNSTSTGETEIDHSTLENILAEWESRRDY